jgi:hypothetical protein
MWAMIEKLLKWLIQKGEKHEKRARHLLTRPETNKQWQLR